MCRGLLLSAVLLSAACAAGIKTTADWNPETNFAAFQTYAWTPEDPDGPGVDDLTDGRVAFNGVLCEASFDRL